MQLTRHKAREASDKDVADCRLLEAAVMCVKVCD